MKKLLLTFLLGLVLVPTIATAAPISWDFTAGVLQPLQSAWGAVVKGSYFVASSTTNASTFVRSSTTAATLFGPLYDSTSNGGTLGYVLQSTGTSTRWVATSSLGFSNTFTTSAQLAALLSDETGTAGSAVFSIAPVFTGTSTFANILTTNLRVLGAFRDSTAAVGTLGMVLQTTGTSTQWVATSSLGITGAAGASFTATTSIAVCASGCPYTSIQTALNAGYTHIRLRPETYSGAVSIPNSDTRIDGAGSGSVISCAATAATNCLKIATSSNLTRIIIENLTVDNSLTTLLGVGLDTSNTSNVTLRNVNITDFGTGWVLADYNNQTFYNNAYNIRMFNVNNCFRTEGTLSNDNAIYGARCGVAAANGIAYNIINAEGLLLSNIESEPASSTVIGTALKVSSSSIGIIVDNPWFEGNSTGTEIDSTSYNVTLTGGRITANTLGLYDAGINTTVNTLISSNTTDIRGPATLPTTFLNSTALFGTPSFLMGTTTQSSADNRMALAISSSAAGSNILELVNYGAFATSPAGIGFNNPTGGFTGGTGRIYVNPGSGYTNAYMTFAVANSSKALTDRMTIDVNGNVGIGTTSPLTRLSVSGNAFIQGNLTATGTLTVLGTTSLQAASTTALTLSGPVYDSIKSIGALGSVLQSTGTSTVWVATSSLGIGGTNYWTDAGAITYLTSTTDDLVIGDTSSATAPFWWDESATTTYIGTSGGTPNLQLGTTTATANNIAVVGADNGTVIQVNIPVASASVTAADTFIDFTSNAGSIGNIQGTAVSGTIIYNTFTGSHWSKITLVDEKRTEWAKTTGLDVGFLVESTGETLDTFKHLTKSQIACTRGSKTVYGIYGGSDEEGNDTVLSIGTGFMWVKNTGENLEAGDLLMSSDTCGMAEVQKKHYPWWSFLLTFFEYKSDEVSNITAAKVMEPIVWNGEEFKKVAVIYLGG